MAEKSRQTRFKLIAILGGLLAVLVVSEIAARVYGMLTAQASAGSEKPDNVGKVYTGATLGEILGRVPDDPHLTRILFLGDSYTRGVGVEPNETFVYRVGVLLEKWRPGRYVTINCGVPGMDSIGEWGIYNQIRDIARADVGVQVISPRGLDVDACKHLYPIQEFGARRVWTSKYSYLSALVELSIRKSIFQERFLEYLKGGSTQEQRVRAWRIFLHETLATKRLVEEGGAAYVMVRFPLVGFFGHGEYPLEDVHRQGAALAADLKLSYLDLLDFIRGQDRASMAVSADDPHPSALAHEIAARHITDFLKQHILPKIPVPTTKQARKPRTPQEVAADASKHFHELLEMDPTCEAARLWLARSRTDSPPKP